VGVRPCPASARGLLIAFNSRPLLLGGTRWIVILAQAAASTTVLLLVTLIALIALGRVRGRAALR